MGGLSVVLRPPYSAPPVIFMNMYGKPVMKIIFSLHEKS